MAPVDHLREKAKVLPVRQHTHMLSLQNLLGCYRGSHPNHYMLHRIPSLSRARKGIHHLEREDQLYYREPLDQEGYQAGLNGIHTDGVTDIINNYKMKIQQNM